MSYADRVKFLEENPHIVAIPTAPRIVSGVDSGMQINDGFKEVLAKVGEAHPQSVVADRYTQKSTKQVKTREVVKKHFGKK